MIASALVAEMFFAGAPEYTLTRSAGFYSIRSIFTATTIDKMS